MLSYFKLHCKYVLVFILISWPCLSQEQPNINADLPKISPPSPSVAALMKFEEVPVDNYSGIPDISIPIYSIQSRSKDIAVNLSLNYHPLSIAASEVASYVGLGWNLMAGGTISRTVKGFPDEILESGRIGIYRDNNDVNQRNMYYTIRKAALYGTTYDQNAHNEYMYQANEKGKFDTEQDFYQFNFMGHSGRFYIEKDQNTFKVVRLDNTDDLKIEFNINTSTYKVSSFTIRDDKGNQFLFDINEETSETGNSGSQEGGPNNPTPTSVYFSAYQLSQVKDINGKVLLTLSYNPDNEILTEVVKSTVNKYNYAPNYNADLVVLTQFCDRRTLMLPTQVWSGSTRSTKTKKLKQIIVEGKAKIDFELEGGRQDKDNTSAYRLKSIAVKDLNDVGVKRYVLTHGYSTIVDESVNSRFGTRMILKKVSEGNFTDTITQSHRFYYKTKQGYDESLVYQDYWGYFNYNTSCLTGYYKEPTPGFTTMDVLQKIKLPTGGCKIFNFESNTYSFIGNQALTNFDDNPDNWTDDAPPPFVFTQLVTNQNSAYTFTINTPQKVCISAGGNWNSTAIWMIGVRKVNGSGSIPVTGFSNDPQDPSLYPKYVQLDVGTYFITFSTQNIDYPNNFSMSVTVGRKNKNLFQKQFLYGGGIRIKNIGYFDQDVVADYYNLPNQTIVPAKQKDFKYHFFDNSSKSSGSLVFAKPVYTYNQEVNVLYECGELNPPPPTSITLFYIVTADQNNLMAQKTRGTDVGYKNVTVSETGLGYSKYTYSSPIDVPEDSYEHYYPFFPTKNYDYKRGLLKNEKVFHNNGRILTETTQEYDFEEAEDLTSIKYWSPQNCVFTGPYSTYATYMDYVSTCTSGDCGCGPVYSFVTMSTIYEAFGWAKLKTITKKEYFYRSDNTQDIVSTKEEYTYNPINKKIATYLKEVYGTAEKLKSEYTYYTDPGAASNNNIGQIQEVKQYDNNNLISTQHILYDAFARPNFIAVSKGNENLENKIQFLSYDTDDNPLEVKQIDGITISYIWGYNKTQPIAMIENASYAEIAAGLGVSIATVNGYTQTTLPTNLRTALPNAKVTTYEYSPLIGVTKVTDPMGTFTIYGYDNFGRLQWVKDSENNYLSENDYKYKTQN
ncbi:hypothetical protein FMM05_20185 [Flavobacterium zepuense]|uniref:YD repeat-containing protein n=1 Tax=Flavobacterium zepuense TaxID=2593302 RepID=A0A552UTB7_9FLAO|nr:hypothetical protein [Flavobacterium zepuense]TRW21471.1 hypothetical protein FMM05_20185 [Flavobacterium zepuense]